MSRLVPLGPILLDHKDSDVDTMYSDYSSDISKKMVSVSSMPHTATDVMGRVP